MNKRLFGIAAMAAASMTCQLHAEGLPPIDAEQIHEGEWKFMLTQHEKEAGAWVYTVERKGDAILIHDDSSLFPNIRETGTLVIDGDTYAARSISMDGDFNRQIIDAELVWADGRVTGEYRHKGPGDAMKTVVPFDMEAPEGAIMRWSIFALLPAMPMEEGASYDLKWFSVLSRSFADVTISVGDIENVTTPAGEFEAYAVTIDSQPKNIAYVTTSYPRKLVRVDVVGLDMRMERLPDAEAEQPK